MFKRKLYPFLLIFILFEISSCREEIIPPNSAATNPNQPVRVISNDSYTFILNAYNVSTTYNDYSGLSGIHSLVHIFLTDYRSGTVFLHIYNYSEKLIYQKSIADNVDEITEHLDNDNPYTVQMIFNDFTGNLKIVVDNW